MLPSFPDIVLLTPIYVFVTRKSDQEKKDGSPKMCDNHSWWNLTESKPYNLSMKFYFSSRQNLRAQISQMVRNRHLEIEPRFLNSWLNAKFK